MKPREIHVRVARLRVAGGAADAEALRQAIVERLRGVEMSPATGNAALERLRVTPAQGTGGGPSRQTGSAVGEALAAVLQGSPQGGPGKDSP